MKHISDITRKYWYWYIYQRN